jgi:hypothetical protein
MNNSIGRLIQHSNEMIELAHNIYDSCTRKRNKVKSHYRFILSAYFARSLELFESIILLIQNNRVTDAGVLLRSFSNLIMNLVYIDKDKEKRATLLLFDYATQQLKLYKKSKEFADSIGKSQEAARYIQHYEREKNKLSRLIQEKYPGVQPWDKITILDKAKVNQEMQYIYDLIYADLSRFEHHDFTASYAYVDPDTCNPILKLGAHRTSPLMNQTKIICFANNFLGIVVEFFNIEYKLNWKVKIDEMLHELLKIH